MPAGGEAEAVAFYEATLGIPHIPEPPHLAARGGHWFEHGDLKVHLGIDEDFRPATKAHAAFMVDDLRAFAMAIAAAGHAVVDDEPLDGYDRAYVNDPFANRIELMEPRLRWDGGAMRRSVRVHVSDTARVMVARSVSTGTLGAGRELGADRTPMVRSARRTIHARADGLARTSAPASTRPCERSWACGS